MTIEGTPARTSEKNRSAPPNRFGANSAMYTPLRMPMGPAMRRTPRLSTTVPVIAFCSPKVPLTVVEVSRLSLSTGAAWAMMWTVIVADGATMIARAMAQSTQKIPPRRCRTVCRLDSTADRQGVSADAAGDEAPGEVGGQTDDEEKQAQLGQGAHSLMRVIGQSAVERSGDGRGDGGGGREDTVRQQGEIADDEQHGDGLSQCAAPAEERRSDDAAANVGDGDHADHPVAAPAQGQGSLPGQDRHTLHQLPGGGGHDGDDHEREDERGGEQPFTEAHRALEPGDRKSTRLNSSHLGI